MTSAAEKFAQAIQSLKHANQLQQEAFALLGFGIEVALEDPGCYAIHNTIEDAIDAINEVLDVVAETV